MEKKYNEQELQVLANLMNSIPAEERVRLMTECGADSVKNGLKKSAKSLAIGAAVGTAVVIGIKLLF